MRPLLEHARKQLPKDKPGLIFLRVIGNTNRAELQLKAGIVQKAVQRLFAQTQRIVGVILLTRMYELSEGDQTMWDLWRTIPNLRTRYPAALLDNFANEHIDVDFESPDWTYMARYYPRFIHNLL